RSARPGWRSGFYRVAVQAGVPLGLASLDYGRREVRVTTFIALTGDEAIDLARIADAYAGVRGLRPQQAAPVRLLDAAAGPSDTIVR
ncbi:MAG: 1-acyl-sn-glycerol-3-phosphate acyltransferase, partial [Ramlibacter sp.]